MKAIEKNISRHQNGTLYFVTRRNGQLVRHSLRTKSLEEAKRKIHGALAASLSATREPLPSPITPPLVEPVVHYIPPSIPISQCLDEHDRGLVLVSDGAKEMAVRGRKAVERYCTGWSDFSSVQIWKKYRDSGHERFGRELGSACNHLLWYLRKVVPWAVSRNYLPKPALEELGQLKKVKTNARRIRIPSVQEVNEFLQMVSLEDRDGGDFLRFLASTGLRLRGATRLSWGDVDLTGRQIHVLQKGGKIKILPLTPEALEVLAKRKQRKTSKPFGLDQNAIEVLERRMKRFAKGFDLDLTFFHAFRHYFASRALMSGLTVQEVAELLGHSDGGVQVLRTYGHICSDHLKNAVLNLKLTS